MFDKLTHEQKEAVVSSVKVGGVWATIGVSSWADVASMFAAILSLLFILEWIWKKTLRPFLEDRGIVRRVRRRRSDAGDSDQESESDKVGL